MRARLTDRESMAEQWGYRWGGGSADKIMLRLSNRQASGMLRPHIGRPGRRERHNHGGTVANRQASSRTAYMIWEQTPAWQSWRGRNQDYVYRRQAIQVPAAAVVLEGLTPEAAPIKGPPKGRRESTSTGKVKAAMACGS